MFSNYLKPNTHQSARKTLHYNETPKLLKHSSSTPMNSDIVQTTTTTTPTVQTTAPTVTIQPASSIIPSYLANADDEDLFNLRTPPSNNSSDNTFEEQVAEAMKALDTINYVNEFKMNELITVINKVHYMAKYAYIRIKEIEKGTKYQFDEKHPLMKEIERIETIHNFTQKEFNNRHREPRKRSRSPNPSYYSDEERKRYHKQDYYKKR
jgi:hypothetical protein